MNKMIDRYEQKVRTEAETNLWLAIFTVWAEGPLRGLYVDLFSLGKKRIYPTGSGEPSLKHSFR